MNSRQLKINKMNFPTMEELTTLRHKWISSMTSVGYQEHMNSFDSDTRQNESSGDADGMNRVCGLIKIKEMGRELWRLST